MVNSKKMSKSSIAVIVLSILLVLSMILGLTGAWFTDSANGNATGDEMTWGTIHITGTGNYVADYAVDKAHVMPGDTMDYTGTVTVDKDSQDVYVFVNKSSLTLTAGDGYEIGAVTSTGWSEITKNETTYYYVALSANANASFSFTITLNADEAWSESPTFMGKPLEINTITLNFQAIQQANFETAAAALDALLA